MAIFMVLIKERGHMIQSCYSTVAVKMASPSQNSYEYKFIAELDDDLKCLICLGVARDPLQHVKCGKLFCKECLEKFGKDKPCPNCRVQHYDYYEDIRGKSL